MYCLGFGEWLVPQLCTSMALPNKIYIQDLFTFGYQTIDIFLQTPKTQENTTKKYDTEELYTPPNLPTHVSPTHSSTKNYNLLIALLLVPPNFNLLASVTLLTDSLIPFPSFPNNTFVNASRPGPKSLKIISRFFGLYPFSSMR